ncbi:MAG: hypothetical protein KF754_02635 [Planctomycetes bacterium]|nr:hypothetical protein [Planctomycetota bacterium]
MKIAFHGQRGSYAEAAAAWMYADRDIATVPSPTVQGVLDALLSGSVQLGVVRFETSEAGTNYDLLDMLRHNRIYFSREIRFHERYNLAGSRGSTRKGTRRVLAHPAILNLCSAYLSRQKNLDIIARYDSADAFMSVAAQEGGHDAVVCGDFAASIYGLSILEAGIENNAGSVTRFVSLGSQLLSPPGEPATVSTAVMFELKHEPGALMGALAAFKKFGINLNVVTGRPNRSSRWDYTTYVEFSGRHSDDENLNALAELKQHTNYLQVLGSYDCSEPRFKTK